MRAEVKAAHISASRKVRRNEAKGIKVEDSAYDPRRDISKVNRYNAVQLRSYLKDLNEFRSRRTQFVKGAKGAPLPSQAWRNYAKIQKQRNSIVENVNKQYADVFLDNSDMTIAERMERVVPDRLSPGSNPAVNNPFARLITRAPENVTSEKALRTLVKQAQKQLDPKYMDRMAREGKKTVATFLRTAGQYELLADIQKLNNKQFHMLWTYTNLGNVSSLAYELAKSLLMPDKDDRRSDKWEAGTIGDSFIEVEKLVKWAGKVK